MSCSCILSLSLSLYIYIYIRNVQGTERNGFPHGIMERNGFLGTERNGFLERTGTDFLERNPIPPVSPQYPPNILQYPQYRPYICRRHGPGPKGPGPWARAQGRAPHPPLPVPTPPSPRAAPGARARPYWGIGGVGILGYGGGGWGIRGGGGLSGYFRETIPACLNFATPHIFFLYPKKLSCSSSRSLARGDKGPMEWP